jgi:hypothetical protein
MNIEKAAKKLADCMDYPWEFMPEQGRENMRNHVKAIFEAANAAPAEDVSVGNTASRIRAAVIADAGQEGVSIAEGRFGKALAALCVSIDAENVRAVVEEPVEALMLADCVEMSSREYGGGYFGTEVVQLYRHPHGPVVLPERKPNTELGIYSLEDEGYNACLDDIARLSK